MKRVWLVFMYLVLLLVILGQLIPTALGQQPASYAKAKYEPDHGAYIGAYVDLNSLLNYDMALFNQTTEKKHASFLRYVGYGKSFPYVWVNKVKESGAIPTIAWEPNNGLEEVQDNEYLRSFARACKAAGVPMFIRFASEMNGNWTAYSGNPALFKEKWRLIFNVMKAEAPNVAMVWSVAVSPQSTIAKFYPGDEYVDWVGMSVYNVVYHNNDIRQRADHEDPMELVRFVYQTYAAKKPIMISEYGVSHYTVTDQKEHIAFALTKLEQMYNGLRERYPRIKAIFYFDVDAVKEARPERQINDYSITNHEEVLAQYRRLICDPYFLSDVVTDD
jgi:hypothetical protein